MRALFTGDIHLTDNPRDEYRWDVFPWLVKVIRRRKVDVLFVLGDVTDRKDRHRARLVHRVLRNFETLRKECLVYVLKGNHDFDTDPDHPFFGFMPGFITDPREISLPDGMSAYAVPHDHDLPPRLPPGYDFILLHHTFTGAHASNGWEMDGWSRNVASKKNVGPDALVLSGDIHVPQKLGNIYYCGSPHPVHFGDEFQPRVLFYDGAKLRSIKRTAIRKPILRVRSFAEVTNAGLGKGDQVKVRVSLARRDHHRWDGIKASIIKYCTAHGIEIHGLSMESRKTKPNKRDRSLVVKGHTPRELLDAFCKDRNVDDEIADFGRELLDA